MKSNKFKHLALATACGAGLLGIAGGAQAANWLMLQGTEPAGAAARAKVWGFLQPEYQQTSGTELKFGPWRGSDAVFNMIRPDLKTDSTGNILRARLGVRGTGFPIDSNVNYFLLAEFGNNGVTARDNASVKMTDASITFNHIKGARVRVGQFKTPGSEEGLQAIHVFDYVNFTNMSNTLLLERFFDSDGFNSPVTALDPNRPNSGVGAFRDIGIQVFDTFKNGDIEHSYAAMVGQGNGTNRGDNDDNKEVYLYWSTEKVFGGKGPRLQSWKGYAWYQDGERTLLAGPAQVEGEFDRKRWGLGTTYRKGQWRFGAEYVKADGMIFNGTDGGAVAGTLNNPGTRVAGFNVLTDDEADGWYIDAGWKPTPKWEIDLRYDHLNRGTETNAGEREFSTWTIGAQYFFNKKSRVLANYEIRDAEAPNLPSSAGPNRILDSMDNRLSVQALIIF